MQGFSESFLLGGDFDEPNSTLVTTPSLTALESKRLCATHAHSTLACIAGHNQGTHPGSGIAHAHGMRNKAN